MAHTSRWAWAMQALRRARLLTHTALSLVEEYLHVAHSRRRRWQAAMFAHRKCFNRYQDSQSAITMMMFSPVRIRRTNVLAPLDHHHQTAEPGGLCAEFCSDDVIANRFRAHERSPYP